MSEYDDVGPIQSGVGVSERQLHRKTVTKEREEDRRSEKEKGSVESARAAQAEREQPSTSSPTLNIQRAEKQLEQAEKALEQAEGIQQEYGSTITWGNQTYDLGTTQGYRDYRQALRTRRSELNAYERELQQYRTAVLQSRAPEPLTSTTLPYTAEEFRETGPPRAASAADIQRLRSEGYDLPEDRTIYISPDGEVYYYEGEPQDSPTSLSRRLWAEAMATPGSETGRFLGIPYSAKGVKQIGAVLAGSVERATTPVSRLIPGQQPFETTPEMDTFTLYDLAAAEDLSMTEKRIALATGVTTEAALTFGVSYTAGYVGGAVIGASGALVSRIPVVGPALESGGAYVAGKLSTPIGGALLLGGVAAVEAPKVVNLLKEDRAIGYELLMEASRFAGGSVGVTRGLSFGRTLPARAERLIRGGVTVPEEAIVPGYVTEEGGFPKFSEEPYEPTEAGYREMAEAYTPPELRITKDGIPSWHATSGRIKGETPQGFISMAGKRRGEEAMFWSPAASRHFLGIGEHGYTLRPGVPNIFGEPQLLLSEFPGVEATRLSKTSPEMAKLLKEAAGTGKLFMPIGQMGEAQGMLSPGTEMKRVVKGRFWADIGGKTVKIKQFLPGVEFPAVTVPMPGVSGGGAAATISRGKPTPTTYLPFLSPVADRATKSLERELNRVTASMSEAGSFTPYSAVISSVGPSLPTLPSLPGVTTSTRTSRGQPSQPSRAGPSVTVPLPSVEYPSDGGGVTTPSKTRAEPSGIRGVTLPIVPDYPETEATSRIFEPPRKKTKKGRKKRRAAAERRVDPLKITFPDVKVPQVKVPEVEAPEFKVKVPKI